MQNTNDNRAYATIGNALTAKKTRVSEKASGSMVPPVINDNVLAALFGNSDYDKPFGILAPFDYEGFLRKEGLAS